MNKKGFTLVEMLVAIGIFTIFTGVLITSYIGVVKGLHGAEEYRELYADARHIFDTILENARNSTVYGECNPGGNFNSDLEKLSFCSTDGMKKVTFEYKNLETSEETDSEENNKGILEMSVEEKMDALSPSYEFVISDSYALNSENVNVKSLSFKVLPKDNPFDISVEDSLQPMVVIDGIFERKSVSGVTYTVDLHTSVSLRTYN